MDMCRDMHLVYYCYFPKAVKLLAIFYADCNYKKNMTLKKMAIAGIWQFRDFEGHLANPV